MIGGAAEFGTLRVCEFKIIKAKPIYYTEYIPYWNIIKVIISRSRGVLRSKKGKNARIKI